MKYLLLALSLLITAVHADEVINFPSDHKNMLSGHTWTQEIEHEYGYPLANCRGSNSGQFSQCWIAFSEGTAFPTGAKALRLSIKQKAWTTNRGAAQESYCLIYAYVLKNSTEITNHVAHTETWSSDYTYRDTRRVNYSSITVPVVNGKVALGVGKKIKGNCQVDIAVYLEGYID